jgi:hypothetical protein
MKSAELVELLLLLLLGLLRYLDCRLGDCGKKFLLDLYRGLLLLPK